MATKLFALLLGPSVKRPRRIGRQGGWRQRLENIEAPDEMPSEDEEGFIGELGPGMLLEFCDGWMSAYRLCSHMNRAAQDGASCRLVTGLGKIATSSTPTRHCNEGMFFFLAKLHILNIIDSIADSSWTHFIKPTNLMRLMLHDYPREFKLRFGAEVAKVRSFWQTQIDSPVRPNWANEHSILKGKSVDDLAHTIPIAVHQDAGPCTKTKSADCISFSSLLAEGGEKVTKLLLATCVADSNNDWQVWREVLKDLDEAATRGVDGWFLVLLFGKADEEQRSQKWRVPHYNDVAEICSECLCNRSNRPFTDLSRTARWRPTEKIPKELYFARIKSPRHPLVESRYFTRWFFFLDCMHMLDCKGVAGIVYGSLLCYLSTLARLGPNIAARLLVINDERDEWYTRHPGMVRLPKIKEQHLRKADGWGELHGPAFKAAITRNASGFFLHIAIKLLTSENEHRDFERCMLRVVRSLHKLYALLWGRLRFLSQESIASLRDVCINFGENYMQCREHCRRECALLFNVSGKIHKMQHLPAMAEIMNPAWVACYGEESLVGTTVRTWKQSMHGRYQKNVQHRVLLKRLCGLALRLEGH